MAFRGNGWAFNGAGLVGVGAGNLPVEVVGY